ncbi:MAG: hypothetical protein WKF87_11815 [Chryseolinea sp.]
MKALKGFEKIQQHNFAELSAEESRFISNWDKVFQSIEEIKNYQYEGVDIGMGVASSYISYVRNPNPSTQDKNQIIARLFKASFKVYFSFRRILNDGNPDLVYLFNGRFSSIRPVVRLCQSKQIEFRIHERGSNKMRYQVSRNHLPHDFRSFQNLVEQFWIECAAQDRVKIADNFFNERKAGMEQAWHSFTASQKIGQLPADWNPEVRNIVIFNSSEDEFAAIGDTFKINLFDNQLEGIKFISSQISDQSNVKVYVRMHPNLRNVTNTSVTDIYQLASESLKIIAPESEVSSYQLIDSADAVITFGSTVGIEASYWGKPSILIGDAFYKDLHSTYNPDTREELIRLLFSVTEPRDRLGAYKYGFYVSSYGIEFKYYEAGGLFDGKFKGKKIVAAPWISKHLKKRPFRQLLDITSRIHAQRF